MYCDFYCCPIIFFSISFICSGVGKCTMQYGRHDVTPQLNLNNIISDIATRKFASNLSHISIFYERCFSLYFNDLQKYPFRIAWKTAHNRWELSFFFRATKQNHFLSFYFVFFLLCVIALGYSFLSDCQYRQDDK